MGSRTIPFFVRVLGFVAVFAFCASQIAFADDGSTKKDDGSSGQQAQDGNGQAPKPPQPPQPPQPPAPPKPIGDVRVVLPAAAPQPPAPPAPGKVQPPAAPADGAKPADGGKPAGAKPADNKPPDKKPADNKPPAPMPGKVKVMKFHFSGNTVISSGELEARVAGNVGKEFTLDELKHIADSVTAFYRARGFSVAMAYIPQQEIKDGVVEIAVLEGRLGMITVMGNQNYSSEFIAGYLKKAAHDGVISEHKLTKELLLLNEYPDLKVNVSLAQGQAPGTVDMNAVVQDRFPLTGGIDFNNYGAPSTGRNRIGMNLTWENVPLVTGSDLALRGVIGDQGDNFDYFRGSYTMPFVWDTKFNIYGFWGTFQVDQLFEHLGISGDSWGGGWGWLYPCIRQSDMSLSGELGMEISETKLDMLEESSSRDRIRKVWVAGHFDNICWSGHDWVDLTIAKGLGGFLGGSLSDHETDRHKANDDFTKYNLTVSRMQSICSWLDILFRAQGQVADHSLMAPEQLQIGGADTVRGYIQGTASGDDGYTVSLEPRVTLCRDRWYVPQIAAFVDHGGARVRDVIVGQHQWEHLTGAGCGARWACPYNIDLRFDVGWPVGGDTDSSRDPEFYISGSVKF